MIKTYFIDGDTPVESITGFNDLTLGIHIETLDKEAFLIHVWKRTPELTKKLAKKAIELGYDLSSPKIWELDHLVIPYRSEFEGDD